MKQANQRKVINRYKPLGPHKAPSGRNWQAWQSTFLQTHSFGKKKLEKMGFSFVHKSRVVDDSYGQPATNLNAVTKKCKTTENEKLQTKTSQTRRTENPLPR